MSLCKHDHKHEAPKWKLKFKGCFCRIVFLNRPEKNKLKMLRLCTGGTQKRNPWDLKGKVSDMEDKVRTYQIKVKTLNQQNEVLKDSVSQSHRKIVEVEKELQIQRSQNGYEDYFIWKINVQLGILLLKLSC